MFAEFLPLDQSLLLPFKGVVIELLGAAQSAAINRLQALQRRPIGLLAARKGRQTQVRPAVIEALIPLVAGCFRPVA